MVIYIDMDGVLVDFDKKFKQEFGMSPKEGFEQLGDTEVYNKMNQIPDYWKNMDWTSDGKELWSFFKQYNPKILTTPAKSVESCKQNKIDWVTAHIGSDVEVIFSANKEEYANENSYLIDDRKENIEKFNNNKGHGILHTTAESSIKKFQELTGKKAMEIPSNNLPSTVAESPQLTDSLISEFINYFYVESESLGGDDRYTLKYCILPRDIVETIIYAIIEDNQVLVDSSLINELIKSLFPEIPYFEISEESSMGSIIINYVVESNEMAV